MTQEIRNMPFYVIPPQPSTQHPLPQWPRTCPCGLCLQVIRIGDRAVGDRRGTTWVE